VALPLPAAGQQQTDMVPCTNIALLLTVTHSHSQLLSYF